MVQIGQLRVEGVSDGTFVARPSYFGPSVPHDGRPDFFDRDGTARLPIGSFVIRVDDRVVLVDAGLGPHEQQLPDGMRLVGGRLLTRLGSLGVSVEDITDVVCTHLHADHVGWLFDLDAAPVFSNALVWFGAADWTHFIDGDGECADHIRRGFLDYRNDRRLRPLTGEAQVAPGIVARPAPGHTPGSLYVELSSSDQLLLLLGDAITCPIQLDEPGWHSFGDVDVTAAEHTRQVLWAALSDGRTQGVGSHFPDLRPGHVLARARRTWQ